jgi:hypothetical protein
MVAMMLRMAWPVLMVAIVLGVMPAGQCASVSLWNKCCCAVEEAPKACCAKHAAKPADTKIHPKTNSMHGCPVLPAQALLDTHANASQVLAHIDLNLPVIHVVSLDPVLAEPVPVAELAHPPDTPLFVLVRSLLI